MKKDNYVEPPVKDRSDIKDRTVSKFGSQGDLMFVRVKELPTQLKELSAADNGNLVISHSESGHNHEVKRGEARMFESLERDPLQCYLQIDGPHADILHMKSGAAAHLTTRLLKGFWKVRRQREMSPEGWKQVED